MTMCSLSFGVLLRLKLFIRRITTVGLYMLNIHVNGSRLTMLLPGTPLQDAIEIELRRTEFAGEGVMA